MSDSRMTPTLPALSSDPISEDAWTFFNVCVCVVGVGGRGGSPLKNRTRGSPALALDGCVKPTLFLTRLRIWRQSYEGHLPGALPGGPLIKNPPANAGQGSNPWCRKIPTPWSNKACAPQLLSLAALEPMLLNSRSRCKRRPTHCN